MADKPNIQAQVKEITDRLEQGVKELFTSEKYAAYLQTMSRFHSYSTRNTLLIHMQKPDATLVAGFNTWKNQFKRHVRKGEKGIRILAPTPLTIKKEMEKLDPDTQRPMLDDFGLPVTEEVVVKIPRFKPVSVFDLSQTEGEPLPSLAEEIGGNVEHYELLLEAIRGASPLPIAFEPMKPEQDGVCRYGEGIALREGMSETQTICAAIHEVAHAMLHDPAREPEIPAAPKDDRTQEVEAESVSYAVCQYFGIETAPNSFGYLASWSGNQSLKELNTSLDLIRRASAVLIDDVEKRYRELAAERGIKLVAAPPRQEAEQPVVLRDIVIDLSPKTEESAPSPAAQAAFDRLTPGDEVYLDEAKKPVVVVSIREQDVVFAAPELGADMTRSHDVVIRSLGTHEGNRHLLDTAQPVKMRDIVIDLSPRAEEPASPPARETEKPEPELQPNQHIEEIGGVEFVVTTVTPSMMERAREPAEQAAARPAPEKQYELHYGYAGNGLTVWNRLEEKDGDYVKVAHIDPDRTVQFYDDALPGHLMDQIRSEARTCEMTTSATNETPVFHTPPQAERDQEPPAASAPVREADQILEDIGGIGALFGKPAPPTQAEPARQPGEIVPDPSIGAAERDRYGYTAADMLPLAQARALELFDQGQVVYLLFPDNTEQMAFGRSEIETHTGIFGVDAAEWRQSPGYDRLAQSDGEAARESAFIHGEGDAFAIYQLKGTEDLRYHRFTSMEQLERDSLAVDRANYNLVYTAPLREGDTLDHIYMQFNNDHPEDFQGHSLSVSDVVALRRDGGITSHYVDSTGFAELPAFLGVECQPEAERPTYSRNGNMLEAPQEAPTVAELEQAVSEGKQISLMDLARAQKNEQKPTPARKTSILARLRESQKTAAQAAGPAISAPKRDSEREV